MDSVSVRRLAIAVSALLLFACGSPPEEVVELKGTGAAQPAPVATASIGRFPASIPTPAAAPTPAPGGERVSPSDILGVGVYFATNRKFNPQTEQYTHEKGAMRYGWGRVTIPPIHQVGHLERPTWWQWLYKPDPRNHITLEKPATLEEAAFWVGLSAEVAATSQRALYVFIHGFNTTFEDAMLRTGQIAFDLIRDTGATVLFSWPSTGGAFGAAKYTVDQTKAEKSVPDLKRFLEEAAARTGARSVNIIAHSMGNQPLVRALHEIALSSQRGNLRLNEITIAAADFDAEVFETMAAKFRSLANHFTLYASSNDSALQASRMVAGYRRAGDTNPTITLVDGFDSIDASAYGTDIFSHGYVFEKSILADLFYLLRHGIPVSQRNNIQRINLGDGRTYWRLAQ